MAERTLLELQSLMDELWVEAQDSLEDDPENEKKAGYLDGIWTMRQAVHEYLGLAPKELLKKRERDREDLGY